jgi:FtsZ-interacting cell division protein ZipA
VLPGPLEPVATMDLLYGTARQLATDLAGMMQDEQGNPLSPQRAGQLREEVVIFQQQLQAASAP